MNKPYRQPPNHKPRRDWSGCGTAVVAGLALLTFAAIAVALLGMIAFSIWNVQQKQTLHSCTVVSKESVPQGKSGNQYRVYTEGCGVLSVEDSLWARRWDSADVYQRIEEGVTYDFAVQGGRYPFFSMFPNVLSEHEPR